MVDSINALVYMLHTLCIGFIEVRLGKQQSTDLAMPNPGTILSSPPTSIGKISAESQRAISVEFWDAAVRGTGPLTRPHSHSHWRVLELPSNCCKWGQQLLVGKLDTQLGGLVYAIGDIKHQPQQPTWDHYSWSLSHE